ncbi:MAG: TonB-dependent receptor domain-containing protein, partial [Opitutaceae bacterium]
TEFLDGRVISTIACYDTKRENLSYRDTPREIATGRSPYYIFGNAEASRGLEIELNWSPTDQYQLVGGWSHVTAAETTKSNNATFAGRRFGGIPQNTYVLWNRYSFESAPVKGLTFGFGVRHHDDANLSPDPNNIVRIPSFTVWDAMAAYRFRAFKHDTRVQFNVKNLTDELHREGADGFFGQARTYYLSLSTRL